MKCPKCSGSNTALFDLGNQLRCADCGLIQAITACGNPNPDKSWVERMFLDSPHDFTYRPSRELK